MSLGKVASRVAAEAAAKPVLKLQGPFSRSRGASATSDWTSEVQRDVRIESPALEAALSDPSTAVQPRDMDGTHVFTVRSEIYRDPGDASVGLDAGSSVEDWEVVGVDGLYFQSAGDAQAATAFVDLTADELEAIGQDAHENYEPPFDPPDDD